MSPTREYHMRQSLVFAFTRRTGPPPPQKTKHIFLASPFATDYKILAFRVVFSSFRGELQPYRLSHRAFAHASAPVERRQLFLIASNHRRGVCLRASWGLPSSSF